MNKSAVLTIILVNVSVIRVENVEKEITSKRYNLNSIKTLL